MGQQLQVTVRWANFASQKLCFITGCAPPLSGYFLCYIIKLLPPYFT